MSGMTKGAKKGIHVTRMRLKYTGDTVKKDSAVTLDQTEDIPVKIGLRLRKGQRIDRFEITPAGSRPLELTEISPTEDPGQYADVNAVLPAATEERWILYTTDFKASYGNTFSTSLQLSPDPNAPNRGFTIHDQGFQIVTIIATRDGTPLKSGHYLFGVSLINGKSNTNEPYTLDGAPAKPKSTAKAAKKTMARKTSTSKARKKK